VVAEVVAVLVHAGLRSLVVAAVAAAVVLDEKV
jgi:hypothetical protein